MTDRDLAIRGLGTGKGPDALVRELMTPEPVTCIPEDEVEDLRQVMIEHMVRRVPVVDADGKLVGIVAQADIVKKADDGKAERTVEKISQESGKHNR